MLKKMLLGLVLLAFPFSSATGSNNQNNGPRRAVTAASKFVVASDSVCSGDSILSGIGCVTGELSDYGFDVGKYAPYMNDDKVFMIAENDENVYAYVYSRDPGRAFDRISLSTIQANEIAAMDFLNYEIELVSFSKSKSLRKYFVKGLFANPDAKIKQYTVRQLYFDSDKNNSSAIMPIGLTWLISKDPDTNQNITTFRSENVLTVTNKMVAFANFKKPTVGGYFRQAYYSAVNFNMELEKIINVTLEYNSFDYVCVTEVGDVWGSTYSHFLSQFNGYKSCRDKTKITDSNKKTKTIISESKEYTSATGLFGWFNKIDYKWNTIFKTNSDEAKNYNLSESAKTYQWVIQFDERDYTANGLSITPGVSECESCMQVGYSGSGITSIDDEPSFEKVESLEKFTAATEVTDLTILKIRYLEEGTEKEAIVVDQYTTSSGHEDFSEGEFVGFFEGLSEFFNKLFSGQADWLQWIVIIGAGLIAIPLLPTLITLISYFIKAIFATIKLLLGSVKWLFVPKKKKKKGGE